MQKRKFFIVCYANKKEFSPFLLYYGFRLLQGYGKSLFLDLLQSGDQFMETRLCVTS